ncbi:MAG: NAD(P)/FAD-dependent oxidoreductase [Archaeoglobaceae archaeon]|nr:NAD(P)/FAD-dependent oxidoreductase [Archaeoglobaceae archaeon]MCX8151587.1 NAD(P)/FAD-dependent oxidoreductase [Archaeoglobaceae archaeon]MDW8013135.1 FAD/NAD(P)-binding oxidoreductase [Archaeoglobaceae archaeon]
MVTVDYVVVGAGYAGLMCGKKLTEKGLNTLIFEMRESGGELVVFSKLDYFREKYEKYIKEVEELKSLLSVEKGTVIKSKPVIVSGENGLKRLDARKVLICTGAADLLPLKLNFLRKKMNGIYTLDNALRLIAEKNRIGEKILIAAKNEEVVKIAEQLFLSLNYNVETVEISGEINVFGKERVESVEAGGENFKCDTLVIYKGREAFNPLKLRGTPVGNIVTCTYNYSKVESNVKNFLAKL